MTKNKKQINVVLTDFVKNDDWTFIKVLSRGDEQWLNIGTYCGRKTKVEVLKCYIKYFTFPLGLILKGKRYGKILAWQQFFGLNYAFFSRLLHLRKCSSLYVMTFIYKPKGGVIGKIYGKYMRYIINSKFIDRCICFSSSECVYYKHLFDIDKFVYIPLGIEPVKVKEELRNDGYIFSTGRSNRDYNFLINALSSTDYKLRIACGLWNFDGKLPDNTTLLHNCYGEQMIKEMAHCMCVVIPLKDLNISAGQLVILQAMQLGKPVIVTRSKGVADYIKDGENGLLMNNCSADLLACLKRLDDAKEYSRISNIAHADFNTKHTIDAMATNILRVL